MNNQKLKLLLGTAILAIISCSANVVAQGQTTELTFCQFPLPDNIKNGHATFNIRYSFFIDEGGIPVDIKDLSKLSASIISSEKVEECISQWRFAGTAPKSVVVAVFQWEHGKGWTELVVAGKEIRHKVKISGERCPYTKQ